MNLGRLARLGRAPLPEWQELAWVARPRSWLPSGLTRWLADHLYLVALPYLGLVVALLAQQPAWALALALLAAVLEWAASRADSRLARILDTAGLIPTLRAAGRALLVSGTLFRPTYVASVVVILLAWLGLLGLLAGFSRSLPPLRYQPGAEAQPEPLAGYLRCFRRATGTPGWVVVAEAVALAGAAFAGQSVGLPLPFLAGALALMAAAVTAQAFRGLLGRAAADADRLLAELAATDPRYLVHVSLGAEQSRYIVNQWLPVLDATGINGLLAVREASQLLPLRVTRVPVVYAPSPRQLEQVTVPSVRVGFYLAFGEKNAHLLREPRLTHVMLLHGDSDKATSTNAQVAGFGEIWVAGQAGIDRYRAAGIDLPDERFVVIGRPQVEPLLAARQGTDERPVLLYAPTFEGYYAETAHSSLDTMGPAMIRRLLAGFPQLQVWFKPHPASGVVRPSMLAAIAEIEALLTGGEHVIVDRSPALTLTDCLARADVLLSDISSVVSDFLATGRPVIVTNPGGLSREDYRAAYPSQRGSYVVDPDLADFDVAVTDALGPDPLRPEREALVGYLLGTVQPQAAFDAALARLAQ
ncbi:MAG: CDP-glycerol glycerophosphotransferase family protein [Propionicimonas sp.]